MPSDRELAEFVYDERISFRLPARHKKLLEAKARDQFESVGDVLREIVREWVREKEKGGAKHG